MNIVDVDLNLLVVFDALLTEGSVTRAARRIGLSQPACSHALRRLREQIGEPLFTKAARGMAPTPRALALAEPVRTALRKLQHAFEPPVFDLARSAAPITIGLNEYLQAAVLPRVVRRLSRAAPGAVLHIQRLRASNIDAQLAEGQLDLAIDWFGDTGGADGVLTAVLFREPHAAIAREKHPAVAGRLTLSALSGLKHVLISQFDEGISIVDSELARLGVHRQVGVSLPNLLTTPWVVAHSDFLAIVPTRMGRWFARILPLQVLDLPVAIPASILRVRWHDRVARNAAVMWIKEQLLDVGQDMDQGDRDVT